MTNPNSRVSALILAFGLVAASLVFTGGFVQSRTADRYVTVKGIAAQSIYFSEKSPATARPKAVSGTNKR